MTGIGSKSWDDFDWNDPRCFEMVEDSYTYLFQFFDTYFETNITSKSYYSDTTWLTSTYTYSATVQPHAVRGLSNGWNFDYDSNGNMIERTDGSGSYLQEFDVENRLVAVTNTLTLSVTRFTYDGNGARVMTINPDSSSTVFVGEHYEVEGSTTRSYYYLGGQRIAMRIDDGQESEVYWFHTDHLGSTSTLSDISGNEVVTSTVRFYPYGEYRVPPTSDLTDKGYTGHAHNDPVALIYMRARYYSASLGRFLSADSIIPDPSSAGSYNRYQYAAGNPANYRDPSGHCIPGVDCPTVKPIMVGNHSAAEMGNAYQYQGANTNECGPSNLAMLINIQFHEAGINYQVSGQELGKAMSDGSRRIGTLGGIRGYRFNQLWSEDYRGATPPWAMVMAYDEFNSELEAAGYQSLGSIEYHYGGTKSELLDNLRNGTFSTLMLAWEDGGAHYATVVGYDSSTDEFLLLDPLRGGDRSGEDAESRFYRESWSTLDENWSRRPWWLGYRNRVIIESRSASQE